MGLVEKHKALVRLIRKGRALKFFNFTGPIKHHNVIRVVEKYDSACMIVAIMAFKPLFAELEIYAIDNLGTDIEDDADSRTHIGDYRKEISTI